MCVKQNSGHAIEAILCVGKELLADSGHHTKSGERIETKDEQKARS